MQHHIRHWSIDYILFLLFISSLTTTISLGLFPQHQSSAFLRRISNTCTTHNFRHTNYLLQHDFNLFPHTHNNNQCSHLTFQCTKGTTEPQLILSYFCFIFYFFVDFFSAWVPTNKQQHTTTTLQRLHEKHEPHKYWTSHEQPPLLASPSFLVEFLRNHAVHLIKLISPTQPHNYS